MTDTKHGTFGRPSGLPEPVQRRIDWLHEHLDEDWIMGGGWIAVRVWETPEHYAIVVARVERETELVRVDKKT